MEIIWEAVWYFLPAITANMVPVFAARHGWLSVLDKPIDGGVRWRGKYLLGENKTVRGIFLGVLAGYFIGVWQGEILLGVLLSSGALTGDLVKSFWKRRRGIGAGESWKPWDQVDFVLGAILFSLPVTVLPVEYYLTAIVLVGAGSYIVSVLGVRLGIKKSV